MIRLLLYGLIIILIIRMFNSAQRPSPPKDSQDPIKPKDRRPKRVSKEVGEYVDYEEVKEEDKA